MKVAFFVNEFPEVSDTFILNQIVGSLQRGCEVCIYAQQRMTQRAQHADVERYQLLDHTKFFPTPVRWSARLKSGAKRLARWGWSNPRITMDSINVLRGGRSVLNLRLLHELLPPLAATKSYDVIHCHYGPNGTLALNWRDFKALQGQIITTFHGYDVNQLPKLHGADLYKKLFGGGELFTVGSEFLKKRIIRLGAPEDRIVKLPMGVDLSRYRFAERRAKFGGRIQLLTVARLVEVKGIEYAIRAVAILKSKYQHIQYQIVGDGPLRNFLEDLVLQLGIRGQVEFLGALSQEDIVEIYEAAHVFILPSVITQTGEEENQSLVLIEAQASGLPVIATRIGGNSESIREGRSGLLTPPRDVDSLAEAIEQLLENPQTWGRMGREGRAHVESCFCLETLNDQLMDLYRLVTSNSERTAQTRRTMGQQTLRNN
jgi:colanic acid/amylovoran biosynthesis glycosyltransferase